ncbi:MAG: SMC-Scp complex subunit ScpB [Acetilactobacillus jinshanensis]
MLTKRGLNNDIQRYLKNTHTSILTSAALETLTIIAYNQPVTRIEVDNVRGVNSSVTIKKLLRQRLIKKAGRKKVLGNPIMYKTTDAFLNLFGLKNLKQLPKIKK